METDPDLIAIMQHANAYANRQDCGFCKSYGETVAKATDMHQKSKEDAEALDAMRKQAAMWEKVHETGRQKVQEMSESIKDQRKQPVPVAAQAPQKAAEPEPVVKKSSGPLGILDSLKGNLFNGSAAETRIRPIQHMREINSHRPRPIDMITEMFK